MKSGRQGFGRNTVRLLGILGVFLVLLSACGWWLSTRVLDANGFADVVAKSSQRDEVRDYIADQATLRLAPSSNFVSSARPVVSSAISEAIASEPVQEAVYDFALLAHDQVFRITQSKRVDVSSAQAALTVRAALEAANPALAKKLPDNVLSATTTISQSETVDLLFRVGDAIDLLYIPILLLGVAVLAFTIFRARDRVHAIRAIGMILAIVGALLMGIGLATPAFAVAAGTNDVGRGDAVAEFIDVAVGRLYGAGKGMVVIGVLLALAPGRDGDALGVRVDRVRAWFAGKRTSPRWRFAGGLALALLAGMALTNPGQLGEYAIAAAALVLLYAAIVVCLRASGMLVTDPSIKRLHKREVALVVVALFAGTTVTAIGATSLVASGTNTERASPTNQGCNGFVELCLQRVDTMMWPGSHNAMSSAAYDFYGAEHTVSVPEQLNAGARFLMLDAYYGYDDRGLVRTNLGANVDRKQLAEERGGTAVRELDRLGALTGVVDTSGKKQDVYFCHDYCELGAVPAQEVLHGIGDFLDRNLTDVVIIDIEDYVKPKDFKRALDDAGLLDNVFIPTKKTAPWPVLNEMVDAPKGEDANPRRLIVMFEKQESTYPWLLKTYDVSEETPYFFDTAAQFNCNPKRGGTGKPLFIVNHWLNPGGLPDPVKAAKTNSRAALTKRLSTCIAERGRLPTTIAVNFTASGDLMGTVNRFNAAIARQSGATAFVDQALDANKRDPKHVKISKNVKRLPTVSMKATRAMLGPLTDALPQAPGLGVLFSAEDLTEIERLANLPDPSTTTLPPTSTTAPGAAPPATTTTTG
jgi:hypothetical protein